MTILEGSTEPPPTPSSVSGDGAADTREQDRRVRRPALDREQPIRSWATMFGGSPFTVPFASPFGASGASPRAASTASTPNGTADLSDAVLQGYRVINEYLTQGRQVAQGAAPARGGSPSVGPHAELQPMLQRVMQYGWDFAGMWLELLTQLGTSGAWPTAAPGTPPFAMPSPFFPGMPFAPAAAPPPAAPTPSAGGVPPAAVQGAPAATPAASTSIRVSVSARGATRATLQLSERVTRPVRIHPLRAEYPVVAGIDGIQAVLDADLGVLAVDIRVPDDQPAGIYNGLVVDVASGLPRGALTLEILAPASASPSAAER